jgi:hypothetical protein
MINDTNIQKSNKQKYRKKNEMKYILSSQVLDINLDLFLIKNHYHKVLLIIHRIYPF